MSIPSENQSVVSACVAFVAIALLAVALTAPSVQESDPSTSDTYSKHFAVVLAELPVEHGAEVESEEFDPSLSGRFLSAAGARLDTNLNRPGVGPPPATAPEHDPRPD